MLVGLVVVLLIVGTVVVTAGLAFSVKERPKPVTFSYTPAPPRVSPTRAVGIQSATGRGTRPAPTSQRNGDGSDDDAVTTAVLLFSDSTLFDSGGAPNIPPSPSPSEAPNPSPSPSVEACSPSSSYDSPSFDFSSCSGSDGGGSSGSDW